MKTPSLLIHSGLALVISATAGTFASAQQSDRYERDEQASQIDQKQDQNQQKQRRRSDQSDSQQADSRQPAEAAYESRPSVSRTETEDSQRSDDQRSSKQRTPDHQQNERSDQSARYRLSPEGWMTVAVDYDRDGRYETVETIYVYDFEKARQESESRKQENRDRAWSDQSMKDRSANKQNQQQRGRQNENASKNRLASMKRHQQSQQDQSKSAHDASLASVQGTIESTHTEKLAGSDSSWMLARIESQDGEMVVVCLGDRKQLSGMKLQSGDMVQIKGVRSRLNDREIVMATQVTHDGSTLETPLPNRVQLKRVKAELLKKDTVRFRGFDEPHLLAKVKTKSGRTILVNMGPESKYEDVNLSSGSSMRLLVRPGTIAGERAMIAQEVKIGDATVELPRPDDRTQFKKKRVANRIQL